MEHESRKENELIISDSDLIFDEVYNKEYTPEEYLEEIKKANVLFIPDENIRDVKKYLFSEYTSELLEAFRDAESENMKVDICIADDNYNRLELHADVINITTMIVELVVLPIVINVVSAFLYDRVNKANKAPKDLNANVNIIVENNKRSKKISYSGSIENFDKAMKTIDETIFKK